MPATHSGDAVLEDKLHFAYVLLLRVSHKKRACPYGENWQVNQNFGSLTFCTDTT